MSDPILWLSLTTEGRHDGAEMKQIAEEVQRAVGEEYEVIVADDRVRLMDADEVQQLLQDLQEYAAQFAHEDAMASAIEEGSDGG